MSGSTIRKGSGIHWGLIVTVASTASVVAAYQTSPESSMLRRVVRATPEVVATLPERSRWLKKEAMDRLAQAKVVFRGSRAQSEQALLSQLREAKQRGSLPSV